MRYYITLAIALFTANSFAQPVFKNPGIPSSESFIIKDFIDSSNGYTTTKIDISLKEKNNHKYYYIRVEEGEFFLNEIEVNYNDLTTISEKRVDKRTGNIIELYENNENGQIHFFNRDEKVDKIFSNDDKNIYSRYAYFISFRGFPFEVGNSVTFDTYIAEYGDALSMKVKALSKEEVTVKAGTFECYKLELSVTGWVSLFAPYKSYLYFKADGNHQFVMYQERNDAKTGWNTDELVKEN